MCDWGERRGEGLIARAFNNGDVVSTIVGLFDEFESSSDKLYSLLIAKPLRSGIKLDFAIVDANLKKINFTLFYNYFLLHFSLDNFLNNFFSFNSHTKYFFEPYRVMENMNLSYLSEHFSQIIFLRPRLLSIYTDFSPLACSIFLDIFFIKR